MKVKVQEERQKCKVRSSALSENKPKG